MQVAILKEKFDNRVAGTPDLVKFLKENKFEVLVEKDAGIKSFINNEAYIAQGAIITERKEALKADVIISINPTFDSEIKEINENAIIISLFQPFFNQEILNTFSKFNFKALSLDMIPRITIAQSMDVLSSMASISGYKSVLEAANYLSRYVPMLTTAAGTIPPAKVLVVGAGVAGLQAIATAKRLGAVVEAFDTRLAAKEEVMSLGAKFVEVEGAKDDKEAGGYAVEQSEEYKQKQQEKLMQSIVKSDIVITTALLRGRPAPKIITKVMVEKMKAGSVIIDIASATGGNCELTQDKSVITEYGVTIVGDSELSDKVPEHASQLFSKNIINLLKVIVKEDGVDLDFENPIIDSSLIINGNEIRYNN